MSSFYSSDKLKGKPGALSPKEAFACLQEGAAIVDIRPEYETNYRVFDVPDVYVLPYSSYKEKFQEIPKEKPLIVADSVGLKCSEVAQFLHDQGYPCVAYLAGGVVSWDHSGLPLSKDLGYELKGGCACKIRPKNLITLDR